MDDYDDEFLDEYKAVERAGYTSKLNELVNDINNPSAEERFLVNIFGVGNSIIQDKQLNYTLKLTYDDLNNILDKTQYLINKKFRNPTAFILGYLCVKIGKIDKETFDKITHENILSEFKDAGIQPPDVLRYARFWSG
jgi:hypothetical protein